MQYQTVSVRPSQSKGWRRERRRERRATNSQRLHFRLSLTDNNELSCFGDCLKVLFVGLDLAPIAAAETRGVVDDGRVLGGLVVVFSVDQLGNDTARKEEKEYSISWRIPNAKEYQAKG